MSKSVDFESTQSSSDGSLAGLALEQVARDLALYAGCEVVLGDFHTQRVRQPPCAGEGIHIALKLCLEGQGEVRGGCLLMPLPDAIGTGALLAHKAPEEVAALRTLEELDDELKGHIVEVGCVVGGSIDNALRWFLEPGALVRAAGCQGLQAGAPPYVENPAGVEYIVASTEARIANHEPRTWTLVVPDVFAANDS